MSKPVRPHSQREGVMVIAETTEGLILQCYGATVPTDGADGFAIGCIFQHTDGGVGTTLYANEGSATSCDFDAITVG